MSRWIVVGEEYSPSYETREKAILRAKELLEGREDGTYMFIAEICDTVTIQSKPTFRIEGFIDGPS